MTDQLVCSPTSESISHEDSLRQNEILRHRVATLELQLSSSRAATRAAYSALLENDMAACLEDGTPVLTLVLEHNDDLRKGLANVYLDAGS